MKKALSPDQEKFLCLQYISGKTMRELTIEWKIAIGTVHSILKRNGIKPERMKPIK